MGSEIDWERFSERVPAGTVARQRLGQDIHTSEFMFRDMIPAYQQEHALSIHDLWGRPISARQYQENQEFHERFMNQSTLLRIEILDQSSFHRVVAPFDCEYLINGQWLTFDEVMA